MALFSWLWNGLTWLGGVFVPFLSATRSRGFVSFLRWLLHFVFLFAILACLWYLNYYFDLARSLRSPWPALHKIWLPLLFLLFYILCWLGYWLWNLLGPEGVTYGFPDMDAAWAEAERALSQASLDITESPVFLVLGRPAGGETALFNAAQIPLAVQQTPRGEAPLHVYANRDAIYITCTGSSLLGQQARMYGEQAAPVAAALALPEPIQAPAPSTKPLSADLADAASDLDKSAVNKTTAPVAEEPLASSTVSRETRPAARPLLRNKETMEQLKARLQHLCKLITRARRPYCPLNGILVLVPLAGSDSDVDASQVGTLCQMDLQVVREVVQVECPIYLLACDLEKLSGFREFLGTLPEAQKSRPLGLPFPLVPDIDPPDLPAVFEGGITWLCKNLLASLIFPSFRLEAGLPPSAGQVPDALRNNIRLYQFLAQMRERHHRLARIAYRGTLVEAGAPPMVGGFFLAGTGVDAVHDQAFVAGVFADLLRSQNFVTWTPQALADETSYRRIARLGYVSLGTILLVGGMGLFFVWNK